MFGAWLSWASRIAEHYLSLGRSPREAELMGLALADVLLGSTLDRETYWRIIRRIQGLPEGGFDLGL